jgi:hypothetical protein
LPVSKNGLKKTLPFKETAESAVKIKKIACLNVKRTGIERSYNVDEIIFKSSEPENQLEISVFEKN